MARTTGYTCTAVVGLILEWGYVRMGLVPPEFISEQTTDFQFVLDYMAQRAVIYKNNDLKDGTRFQIIVCAL